jgi:hypothetical protein
MILGPEATLAQAQRKWFWFARQVSRPAKRISKDARLSIVYNRASPLVSIPPRTHLRREVHAAQEVLKARVGAHVVTKGEVQTPLRSRRHCLSAPRREARHIHDRVSRCTASSDVLYRSLLLTS